MQRLGDGAHAPHHVGLVAVAVLPGGIGRVVGEDAGDGGDAEGGVLQHDVREPPDRDGTHRVAREHLADAARR